MTYWGITTAQTTAKRIAVAALVGLMGASLTGCGTSNNVLGNGNLAANGAISPTSLLPNAQQTRAKIAIAPIIGAPDSVSRQLNASLKQAIGAQRVQISGTEGEPVDYTLRGYVVAAKEAGGTKLSYIWDIMDSGGRRVNRITGEQVVNGSSSRDPWASVSPAVIQTIADKTASSFGTWLPARKPQQAQAIATNSRRTSLPATGTPVGSATQAVANSALAAGSATNALATTARLKPQLAALKPTARTRQVFAIVPSVSGAPGDGRVSLTNAIKRELTRNGITLASNSTAGAYRVLGKVNLSKGKNGSQAIKIDWVVKGPKGSKLGTVSQENKIPQDSLSGAWGKTADAAAGAAAQGILKLLPKPVAVN